MQNSIADCRSGKHNLSLTQAILRAILRRPHVEVVMDYGVTGLSELDRSFFSQEGDGQSHKDLLEEIFAVDEDALEAFLHSSQIDAVTRLSGVKDGQEWMILPETTYVDPKDGYEYDVVNYLTHLPRGVVMSNEGHGGKDDVCETHWERRVCRTERVRAAEFASFSRALTTADRAWRHVLVQSVGDGWQLTYGHVEHHVRDQGDYARAEAVRRYLHSATRLFQLIDMGGGKTVVEDERRLLRKRARSCSKLLGGMMPEPNGSPGQLGAYQERMTGILLDHDFTRDQIRSLLEGDLPLDLFHYIQWRIIIDQSGQVLGSEQNGSDYPPLLPRPNTTRELIDFHGQAAQMAQAAARLWTEELPRVVEFVNGPSGS